MGLTHSLTCCVTSTHWVMQTHWVDPNNVVDLSLDIVYKSLTISPPKQDKTIIQQYTQILCNTTYKQTNLV